MICKVLRSLSGCRPMRFKVTGRAQATAAVALFALVASSHGSLLRAAQPEASASGAEEPAVAAVTEPPNRTGAKAEPAPAAETTAPAPAALDARTPVPTQAITLPE